MLNGSVRYVMKYGSYALLVSIQIKWRTCASMLDRFTEG